MCLLFPLPVQLHYDEFLVVQQVLERLVVHWEVHSLHHRLLLQHFDDSLNRQGFEVDFLLLQRLLQFLALFALGQNLLLHRSQIRARL